MAGKTNTDRIEALSLTVAKLEERVTHQSEETKRIRDIADRLARIETHLAELTKSADQNRITTPTVIGWVLTAIGVLAAITIGLPNYSKK